MKSTRTDAKRGYMLGKIGGGFLMLMTFVMAGEASLIGNFAGPWFTASFGTFSPIPSLIFALALTTCMVVSAYYITKGIVRGIGTAIQALKRN
jgi:hypothetical protein